MSLALPPGWLVDQDPAWRAWLRRLPGLVRTFLEEWGLADDGAAHRDSLTLAVKR